LSLKTHLRNKNSLTRSLYRSSSEFISLKSSKSEKSQFFSTTVVLQIESFFSKTELTAGIIKNSFASKYDDRHIMVITVLLNKLERFIYIHSQTCVLPSYFFFWRQFPKKIYHKKRFRDFRSAFIAKAGKICGKFFVPVRTDWRVILHPRWIVEQTFKEQVILISKNLDVRNKVQPVSLH
jgi:hypothetical protein